jgi:hypothetical protein
MPTANHIPGPSNASEQRFWDKVFRDRFDRCLSELNERGLEGCAQWADEQARVALAQRRVAQGRPS